jgi:hypothetical protein
MSTLYAGPGKIWMNGTALWPEGENGEIRASIEQEVVNVASGCYGRVTGVQGGVVGKIVVTPFDNWGALGLLFPPWLGVSVGTTSGALAIGTRPHGATDVACAIWAPDGRLYTFPRAAVTRHPDLHLGLGSALFGPVEITALIASAKELGDAGSLYTIAESGTADPGGQMGLKDFARGSWTGVWGTAAGFGGDSGGTPIEAEEEWFISSEVKYSPLPVQKLARAYKLDSVAFMAKVRPYGPTHSQIDAAIGVNNGRLLGSQIANSTTAADLALSGPNGKTITLKSADVVGAGFEFGGTKLGTGEIGFVTTMQFAGGVAQPLMVFSA